MGAWRYGEVNRKLIAVVRPVGCALANGEIKSGLDANQPAVNVTMPDGL